MRTPSPPRPARRPERHRPSRAGTALALAALCSGLAQAHTAEDDPLPEAPGWRLGGAAALLLPTADARWPSAHWPGVLGNGSAPRDQRRGLRLEHATLEAAARVPPRLHPNAGGHLVIGWHDRERAHVEAATLQARWPLAGGQAEARLGRDTVPLGPVLDDAGHYDRFSQVPLAKQAALNGPWIDDGLVLAWQPAERGAHDTAPDTASDGLRRVEVGLWRGRAFPGGPAGRAMPTLHLQAGWGTLDAHLGLARLEPQARGAAAQLPGAASPLGHVHGSLDCRASLQQRVCFDGQVDLLAGSLQWQPETAHGPGPWRFTLAGLAKRERGALYTASSTADWTGRSAGAWAELAWQPEGRWTWAARLERLQTRHHLNGLGTQALAQAAGLLNARPVQRLSTALLYSPHPDWQLALEAGQERWAEQRVAHLALRALWRNPQWLGGSW